MSDSYMTMKEIAELCGIRDLKYFRESYITPALEIGVKERLYPNQPKHPKQKYRLTTAAKEWKATPPSLDWLPRQPHFLHFIRLFQRLSLNLQEE